MIAIINPAKLKFPRLMPDIKSISLADNNANNFAKSGIHKNESSRTKFGNAFSIPDDELLKRLFPFPRNDTIFPIKSSLNTLPLILGNSNLQLKQLLFALFLMAAANGVSLKSFKSL